MSKLHKWIEVEDNIWINMSEVAKLVIMQYPTYGTWVVFAVMRDGHQHAVDAFATEGQARACVIWLLSDRAGSLVGAYPEPKEPAD